MCQNRYSLSRPYPYIENLGENRAGIQVDTNMHKMKNLKLLFKYFAKIVKRLFLRFDNLRGGLVP